jgi:hypothetical protein
MHATQIKTWLKHSGQTREWLATQCRVSPTTVDGWLSANRRIPGPSLAIIEELMNNKRSINPKLSLSDYARVQKAAESSGQSVTQWIENAIQKALMLTILGAVIYLMLP